MSFKEFSENLKERLSQPLPGAEAHAFALPPNRKQTDISQLVEANVRKAAVLALIENHADQPHIILTRRSTYNGTHSGQISFPGGKQEKEDSSFIATALRETEEEIGIDSKKVEVIGSLSPIYIPPSNFLVYPFVAISDEVQEKTREVKEVDTIFSLALEDLFKSETLAETSVELSQGLKVKVPAFQIAGLKIWGATAMMLAELREVVLLAD